MNNQFESDDIRYTKLLGGDLATRKHFTLSDGTMATSVRIPKLYVYDALTPRLPDKILAVYNGKKSLEWVMWMIHRSSYSTVTIQQTPPGKKFPEIILHEPWMGHWPPVTILVQRMSPGEDLGLAFFSNQKSLLVSVNHPFEKDNILFS